MNRTRMLPVISFALLGLLGAPAAHATEIGKTKKFGIGVGAGQPSGVEFMWFFKEHHALHTNLGVGFQGKLHVRLNVDYLYHIRVYQHQDFDLPIYFGAGLSFFVWTQYRYGEFYFWGADGQYVSYFGIGVRVPIGCSLQFHKTPIDVFFEVAPGAGLFPGIGAYVDGTAGFRYYF